jgi:hypothetical protein
MRGGVALSVEGPEGSARRVSAWKRAPAVPRVCSRAAAQRGLVTDVLRGAVKEHAPQRVGAGCDKCWFGRGRPAVRRAGARASCGSGRPERRWVRGRGSAGGATGAAGAQAPRGGLPFATRPICLWAMGVAGPPDVDVRNRGAARSAERSCGACHTVRATPGIEQGHVSKRRQWRSWLVGTAPSVRSVGVGDVGGSRLGKSASGARGPRTVGPGRGVIENSRTGVR